MATIFAESAPEANERPTIASMVADFFAESARKAKKWWGIEPMVVHFFAESAPEANERPTIASMVADFFAESARKANERDDRSAQNERAFSMRAFCLQ